MDPNEIYRQALIAVIREGVEYGFNFLTTKLKRKNDNEPDLDSNASDEITPPDQSSLESAVTSEKPQVDWEKPATLFWLGNDLMWIQDQMYRGSSPTRVLEGVENAIQYARRLGFDDSSFPIQNLSIATSILESLPGRAHNEEMLRLIQQHYGTVEHYVRQVKFYIQAKAESREPDFIKLRAL